MIIDEDILNSLQMLNWEVTYHTNKYVMVGNTYVQGDQYSYWIVEDLEEILNAELASFISGTRYIMLRWL